MARRSWPVAVNHQTNALTFDSAVSSLRLPVSVSNVAGGAVAWTGGASSDLWPVAVNPVTGALTYSGTSATPIATDTFTRANGSLTGSTTETGSKTWGIAQTGGASTASIVSNQAKVVNSIAAQSFSTVDTGVTNHEVTVTLAIVEASIGVHVRFIDASNWVDFENNNAGEYKLQRRVAGSYTTIGTTSGVPPTNGDVVRLVAVGTTYTAYVNGTQVLQVTDATANTTGTKVALQGSGSGGANRFDNFTVSAA